jgi:hypothetical protein
MDNFERHIVEQGLQQRIVPSFVFDLETVHPELAAEVFSRAPELARVVAVLRRAIVVPKSATVADGAFYRLANHNRSFCYALSGAANPFASACVVFKGSEPLTDDFDKLVDWMLLAPFRRSSRVIADHFALAEGKIPGTLSLQEAAREATVASELQLRHLRAYGELARLPVPLLVHRFSERDRSQVAHLLERKLAPAAYERVAPLVASGLALYIYYYAAAPIRANAYGSGGSRALVEHVRACDREAAIAGWIRLFARLLWLGYMPYTPRNEGLGACMDFGNATLDGGCCDLDSIEAISLCPDDEFFAESLISSISVLAATVRRVLSPSHGLDDNTLYPSIESFAITRYLCGELERALDREARPDLVLDPRVRELLAPATIATLERQLERKNRPRGFALMTRPAR